VTHSEALVRRGINATAQHHSRRRDLRHCALACALAGEGAPSGRLAASAMANVQQRPIGWAGAAERTLWPAASPLLHRTEFRFRGYADTPNPTPPRSQKDEEWSPEPCGRVRPARGQTSAPFPFRPDTPLCRTALLLQVALEFATGHASKATRSARRRFAPRTEGSKGGRVAAQSKRAGAQHGPAATVGQPGLRARGTRLCVDDRVRRL
jgi:hypothetical protein